MSITHRFLPQLAGWCVQRAGPSRGAGPMFWNGSQRVELLHQLGAQRLSSAGRQLSRRAIRRPPAAAPAAPRA